MDNEEAMHPAVKTNLLTTPLPNVPHQGGVRRNAPQVTVTVPPPASQSRPVQGVLADARTLVEPAHRAVVESMCATVRHLVGYHVGWWDIDGQPTQGSAKGVRSALVLAAATAVGGTPANAVVEAVAVELLHDFTLLHDDIIDGDLTRRHRPAAWTVFGVGEALLAGDMMFAQANHLIADRPWGRVLTGAAIDLVVGQAADMAFENRADVGVTECLTMAAGKTGALLGCACHLGALAGGGDQAQAEALKKFGQHVGLAFQLVDDMLGIWGDPTVTGKPAYSDLANRKKSLPVVAALASGTPAGDHLSSLYAQQHTSEEILTYLAELVEDAGGRAWAQAQADHHLAEAMDSLHQVSTDPGRAGDLTALGYLIAHRDH